ncbi:DUF1397 domain containing protein [Asbolus verrucosus]|uniref:DUF1397 domain containing protein n=1 Tax=Asbolus verrucosus TaxID=1661398 RepID=A0A482VPR9_ASBVE|nr:DUF1397 domain containing protein [Asbolus verrucosus]
MAPHTRRLIYTVTIILFISPISCQNNNDIDGLEKQINSIPGLENFNSSKLPTEEDNQQTEVQTCIESHLNFSQIQLEVEEAKKTGSMDEVFGKYCKKYPEIHQCLEGVTDKVRPCLDLNEQDTLNKTLEIVQELKEFVCFKDGDRIAMFIAEGGVECMESKKDQLQECANKTIGARIPTDMSMNSLPRFLFSERDCSDFDKIRSCFNVELEKCKDSTPANIVDAFFKFLKKHMPCGKVVNEASISRGSAGRNFATSSLIFVVSVIVTKLS